MPAMLSEMNSLSIISPHQVDNVTPRFSNPPPVEQSYQNWTMIEDVLSCQTALPAGTNTPNWMPQYNSNNLIPAYKQSVCPPDAQQTLYNLQKIPQPNIYVPAQLQTGRSFQDEENKYFAENVQYGTNFQYPPFAGSVNELKDAKQTDHPIVMREGYQAPTPDTNTCIECAKHVNDCKLCTKLTQCNNTKWWVTITILICIIIALIAYIMIKNKVTRPIRRI
jgi:hypothetical protein